MKTSRIFGIMILSLLALSSCKSKTIVKTKQAPPGQVKKVTGSKSAAPYAPGQQKKQVAPSQSSTPPGKQKKKN